MIIAGAGGAAHLPGMTASKTTLPVLGVPVQSKALSGLDSLLSIVQMPAGIPVATFAIGVAGATNAGLAAAAILANKRPEIDAALKKFRAEQTEKVLVEARPVERGLHNDHRHRRRRPARPHAGAGRLSTRARFPVPRPRREDARRPGRARSSKASSPTASLLGQLAQRCEVLTFDWENIPVEALESLPGKARICPPLRALAAAQDRLTEKRTFELLGIPTTRYAAVDSRATARAAVEDIGLPGVLKTRRLGYDGKGQFVLRKPADLDAAWDALGKRAAALRKPGAVRLRGLDHRACAARTAKSPSIHSTATCTAKASCASRARRLATPRSTRQAQRAARKLLEHFEYVGVLTIEFFVTRGRLVANEMAPRVHNSGHWTIEGAETSQFENHVRAIAGLPLGSHARPRPLAP